MNNNTYSMTAFKCSYVAVCSLTLPRDDSCLAREKRRLLFVSRATTSVMKKKGLLTTPAACSCETEAKRISRFALRSHTQVYRDSVDGYNSSEKARCGDDGVSEMRMS